MYRVQIANKTGLQKKNCCTVKEHYSQDGLEIGLGTEEISPQ
jgi:hypothetical protein